MYVYIFCIYTYLWKKLKPSINVHVCMHAYMYVWMYGKITNKHLCFLNMNSRKHQKNTRYIFLESLEKIKPSINVHVCMHAYMYVWMYGKIIKHTCMYIFCIF